MKISRKDFDELNKTYQDLISEHQAQEEIADKIINAQAKLIDKLEKHTEDLKQILNTIDPYWTKYYVKTTK